MSDEDDNVVDFMKRLDESKSDGATSVEERVVQCMSNKDCECMYCNYRKSAASMVVDFLARDVVAFEKNSNARFCTFDLKEILFKAILEIKEMEKTPNGEEDKE